MKDRGQMSIQTHVQSTLGQRLQPLFDAGFFRPLARPSAPVYVDCGLRLVEAAMESGQLDRTEARALVREVIEQHPDVILEDDEGGFASDPQQKATQFFNKLLESQWITERRVSLSEQTILIAPQLRLLLGTLSDLAENRPEELKDFGVGLRSLCKDILADQAFDPSGMDGEGMRAQVKDLLERSERSLNQMHAMETLIGEHESAQRQSASARETLKRFLDDFHAGEHMLCYDALRESGVLPRIERARAVLQELAADPFVKERLGEGIARHAGIDSEEAYVRAEDWLLRLETRLASIPRIARQIDARMAEFSNLSAARYRYQTEMRGLKPEQVKAYCDRVARDSAGKKFSDLAHEPGMEFRTVNSEVLFGRNALAPVRARRLPVDLKVNTRTAEADVFSAQDSIRRQTLHSLTPQRAGRFISRYLPSRGDRFSTEELHLPTEDELLDFLAVLTFDRAPVRRSTKVVKWKVSSPRQGGCSAPERIPMDTVGDMTIERLSIERLT